MNKERIKFMLTYLQDLERSIEFKRSELKENADYKGLLCNIATVASELTALVAEQRAICFTLNRLGFYVVYNNNTHAEKIICNDSGEEVTE